MTEGSVEVLSATIGASGYAVDARVGGRTIRADEPASAGGADSGPDPFALLYSALASCVLITIRMYATRKSWALEGATLTVSTDRAPAQPLKSATLTLALKGNLTEEQRERLREVAGRCPVHRSLEGGAHIDTVLA